MFVKENGLFRNTHSWATKEQREIFEQERFRQHAAQLKF